MTIEQERVDLPPLDVPFEAADFETNEYGEHYWFEFDNGYTASVLRESDPHLLYETAGYEDGLWEAMTLYRDEFAHLIGLDHGMPVFDTGLTDNAATTGVAGHLDNEGVAAFLTAISELPIRTDKPNIPTTKEKK